MSNIEIDMNEEKILSRKKLDLHEVLSRANIEQLEKWREWGHKIPFINFPRNYLICIIPPFGGAMARFLVADKKYPDITVSVYLDIFNSLGYFGADLTPYWEVYPVQGDVFRCAMEDVPTLLKGIKQGLKEKRDDQS